MKWLLYGLLFIAVFGYMAGTGYLLERFGRDQQFGRILVVLVVTIVLFIVLIFWSGGDFFPDSETYLR